MRAVAKVAACARIFVRSTRSRCSRAVRPLVPLAHGDRHHAAWRTLSRPGELWPSRDPIREEAHEAYRAGAFEYIIADGPPGIGCPVIGAVTGTGFVVAVTEPTVSGVHDLVRISDLCDHFKRPVGVVLNKADLNPDLAVFIETFCAERGYALLARIPYLPSVVWALTQGRTMDEIEDGGIGSSVRQAWAGVVAACTIQDRSDVMNASSQFLRWPPAGSTLRRFGIFWSLRRLHFGGAARRARSKRRRLCWCRTTARAVACCRSTDSHRTVSRPSPPAAWGSGRCWNSCRSE